MKRNETEKTEKFQKRNGTEKNYKIKKQNGKPQETKRNLTILFRNKKTKRKEKITFPKRINVLFTIFMRLLPHAKFSFWKRNLRFFK
jgi:hypothetical protein